MIRPTVALSLLAAAAFAPPAIAGETEFRACVAAATGDDVTVAYQRCSATEAAPCGQSKTALEAAQCMIDVAQDLNALTVRELESLSSRLTEEEMSPILEAVEEDSARGAAACQLMRQRDEDANTAPGQAAVNDAFCRVLAAGETAGVVVVNGSRL